MYFQLLPMNLDHQAISPDRKYQMHSSSQAKSEQNTPHLLLLSISHCILCIEQFQQSESVYMLTETTEDSRNY